ncbi:MAG TPA: lysophospholipase [Kofleriaceae bacterium]|jgi:alpha-beta hydrolase superfamily lysophospholipase|nr:lysophospholipase [Kofleriaceae bacterium]
MSALPGPMTPTQTLTFPSTGGITLYGEWFAPASPRALAIVVHGYAEHCGRYREVAHALVKAGIAVFTFDQRGHGKATGKRGHVDRFTEYLDDLDRAIAKARELGGDQLPRVLVGHSNGSLISLRALSDPARRPDVKCAVVSSPFLALKLKVPAVKKIAAKVLSRIVPTLALANELRVEDLTHDTQKQDERKVDTLCHGVATARWFTEAGAAQEYVYEHASSISVPTIWLVAGDDPIADPARSGVVHKRLRAPVTYHELAGFRHEVFNEIERGRAFDLMTAFVTNELKLAA